MASVLYFGTDDRVPKMMEQFFQDRLKASGESNSILQVPDETKFNEVLIAMAFDIIFVEQSILARPPDEWLKTLMKIRKNIKSPMIVVGTEADPAKIMKILEAGWIDYVLLPPDKPLLIEKIWMYASGQRSSDLRQVYSMKMGSPVSLAKPGLVEELSEFDCRVRSSFQVPLNDMMILYSNAFSADGNAVASVLGRCYKSEEHPEIQGSYQNSFYFVGITTDSLANIRNSLRKQFVSGKTKG